MIKESDLYLPVKMYLQAQGYEVKGEILECDVVAIKAELPMLIVELKLSFSLELILQAVERLKLSEDVYVAVPAPNTPAKRRNWRTKKKGYITLCKRLGIGLMVVNDNDEVQVLQDPIVYQARANYKKRNKLVKEFVSRKGDPNKGGVNKTKIMTAYRQNVLTCAVELAKHSSMKTKDLKLVTGLENTSAILQKNYYAWFERISRGVYCLTKEGRKAVADND